MGIGAILMVVATPVTSMTLSNGDARDLPKSSEKRQVYDLSLAHFPGHSNADAIQVLVADGIARPDYVQRLRALPGVIDSSQKAYPDGDVVVRLTSAGTDDGAIATGLVETIRGEHQGATVTGNSAHLVDFRNMLRDRLPYAAGVVLVAVCLLL